MPIKPSRTRHVELNGIRLYHEVYGVGDLLVLVPAD